MSKDLDVLLCESFVCADCPMLESKDNNCIIDTTEELDLGRIIIRLIEYINKEAKNGN